MSGYLGMDNCNYLVINLFIHIIQFLTWTFLGVFLFFQKVTILASSGPPVHMYQLSSHWMDLQEISYWQHLWISVTKCKFG
jgi:hypothetical protein